MKKTPIAMQCAVACFINFSFFVRHYEINIYCDGSDRGDGAVIIIYIFLFPTNIITLRMAHVGNNYWRSITARRPCQLVERDFLIDFNSAALTPCTPNDVRSRMWGYRTYIYIYVITTTIVNHNMRTRLILFFTTAINTPYYRDWQIRLNACTDNDVDCR